MIKNVSLKSVRAYTDYGISSYGWFLELVYSYHDDDGTHELIYPKVSLPFCQNKLPEYSCSPERNFSNEYFNDDIGIRIHYDEIEGIPMSRILKHKVFDKTKDSYTNPVYHIDILVDPAIKEMTLDEIEKKLGHKVKIVNEKKGEN